MDYKLAFLLVVLFAVARVQCYAQFISPEAPQNYDQLNPIYTLGGTVDVQWESNYSRFDLYLCQNLGQYAQDRFYPIEVNVTTKQYSWEVSLENVTFRKPVGEYRILYFAVHAYSDANYDGDWNYTIYFNVSLPHDGLTARAAAGIAAASTLAMTAAIMGIVIWKNMGDIKAFQAWKKRQREGSGRLAFAPDAQISSTYLLGVMDKSSITSSPSVGRSDLNISPFITPEPSPRLPPDMYKGGHLTPRPPSSQPPHEVFEVP